MICPRETIRVAAIAEMLERPGIYETVYHDMAPRRESVAELLERLDRGSERARMEVAALRAVLRSDDPTGDLPNPLRSPAEIAAFGLSLQELGGSSIGRELLRRTSRTALKALV